LPCLARPHCCPPLPMGSVWSLALPSLAMPSHAAPCPARPRLAAQNVLSFFKELWGVFLHPTTQAALPCE